LALAQRAHWLHRWSNRGLRILGITPCIQGAPPPVGVIVSNHLSYLDILLFSASIPCVFIAKSEIRKWPLLGWLADGGGTLFIDRKQRSDSQVIGEQMLAVLEQGVSIVFFPEGTTTSGSEVLRFHSSLFEYAVQAQVLVTAACVSYASPDAFVARDVCYWGDMVLAPHLWKLNSIRNIVGNLVFAHRSSRFTDRRTAALTTHNEVAILLEQMAPVLAEQTMRPVCIPRPPIPPAEVSKSWEHWV
jgi:1-acyl-sn-glycerol-3-phosphate acyltransferase